MSLLEYISVAAVTATYGSALTAGHFWKGPKVTKRPSPHHSAPRCGSVCPHAGFGPWAAAMGHPWPSAANPASCRVTHAPKPAFGQRGFMGRLRSRSTARRPESRPEWCESKADQKQIGRTPQICSSVGAGLSDRRTAAMQRPLCIGYTELMPSQASQLPHYSTAFDLHHSGRLSGRRAFAFDLFDLDLRRPIKPRWPHAGLNPWVTRQDAGLAALGQGWPIAAAHGFKPVCGHTEPRRGAEWWGKSPFGYFWGSFPKVTRCKSGTLSGRYRSNGYAPGKKGKPQ
ncbi:hypothetical protein SAMN04515675_0805 [Pseudomonas costantinii]|uniref:Threonine synthase n=1 Tax=Pseudomonas costantinii TaxID=168469 RepID=A0A1H4ZXV2_9PSED|nr:hypothetical protein SAMN04515675_0805 [Pseudomonas costantinii]